MHTNSLVRTVLVFLFVGGGGLAAQITTGTISGTVKDSTGAVVPGSTVVLRNVETGITRTVSTDSSGRYRATQLSLGMYDISAELAGFQKAVRSGIELTLGREAAVDFTLKVGAVAEEVTVTGRAVAGRRRGGFVQP